MKCKNTKIIWNEAILVRLLISFIILNLNVLN